MATTTQQATAWYEVPAGTRPSECRERTCGQTIYWIEYVRESKCRDRHHLTPARTWPCPTCGGSGVFKKTVRQPVDCDAPGGFAPTEREGGRGVSHFTTCTASDRFSR
jgi:hypothetical protein